MMRQSGLKDIDREFSRIARDFRRADSALKRETNKELQGLHKRRLSRYRKKQRELEINMPPLDQAMAVE